MCSKLILLLLQSQFHFINDVSDICRNKLAKIQTIKIKIVQRKYNVHGSWQMRFSNQPSPTGEGSEYDDRNREVHTRAQRKILPSMNESREK